MMELSEIKAAMPDEALTALPDLPFRHVLSGKVREVYAVGADDYLLIATDRLSAFDVILRQGIPGRGILLTQISRFWFERTANMIPNHLVPDQDARLAAVLADFPALQSRSMLVRKLDALPVEAVVRGYLSGSAWKCYRKQGDVFGQPVPPDLVESSAFPEPLFTPTTKSHNGHDEPLTLEACEALLGSADFRAMRQKSLQIFEMGTQFAHSAGLVLADTKFEFGKDAQGELILIDEVLTPDSSRFWPAVEYAPGGPQPSYDKQFVREYLESIAWNKQPPPPDLPEDIVRQTSRIYWTALEKLILGPDKPTKPDSRQLFPEE